MTLFVLWSYYLSSSSFFWVLSRVQTPLSTEHNIPFRFLYDGPSQHVFLHYKRFHPCRSTGRGCLLHLDTKSTAAVVSHGQLFKRPCYGKQWHVDHWYWRHVNTSILCNLITLFPKFRDTLSNQVII